MNFLGRCIEYLKDNPEGYWFKNKCYGFGWTPATWQGWLVTLVFVGLILWNAVRIDSMSHSASDTLRPLIFQTVGLVALLLVICWRTGEPLKWQWGAPKKKDSSNENSR